MKNKLKEVSELSKFISTKVSKMNNVQQWHLEKDTEKYLKALRK